ncbi:SHUGOSHIN 2 isoform X6 [Populus trichocarpa]|uniref:SHUGOSHIN 2 isoform X6 n=1 Tax=Populus trichocarpa TaxID=3694 RepID=UPI000D187AB8|nr:SHUGOSHIN 2 isoform X6 [Populus trichocarpa]|eukprot:XP_024465570.1 SHUGOSHIN 2 isoform X6 [Populus trichocarpa]
MEGVPVLDTENINVAGDKIKGEKLEKGSLVGIAQRKTLVDINNFPAQRKMLADISNLSQRNQYGKSQSVLVSKEHVEKLQRDIMALTKLVADRNKIIELSAIELQKLRVNYQQLQQQNLQLAQTNSQMLAELNAGKDKLKAYQHELGCKNGLLNAKKLELKEKTKKVRSQNMRNEVETIKGDNAAQFSQPEDNKPCNTKRKRQSKVQSLDSSAVKPGQTEDNVEKKSVCLRRQSAMFKSGEEPTEKNIVTKSISLDSVCLRRQSARLKSGEEPNEKDIDTKSVCLRRQSARFKSGEEPTEKDTDTKRICTGRQSTRVKSEDQIQEPAENLFQTDDAKFHIPPLHDDPVHESCPTSSVPSVKIESETGNSVPRFETQELQRTSFRPTRRAVEKVQTYKEIPLNVKMRRSE